MKFDLSKFIHDPDVLGLQHLTETMSHVIAGKLGHDKFMIEWNKASDEARKEFKKFMKVFEEMCAELFGEV